MSTDGSAPQAIHVSHHGDVNGKGVASASDILNLIDMLNGVAEAPDATWS